MYTTCAVRQSCRTVSRVHGNETAPIELLSHLCTDLFAGRLKLAVRLLLVLGNPMRCVKASVMYMTM